jgi:hypothetical protein
MSFQYIDVLATYSLCRFSMDLPSFEAISSTAGALYLQSVCTFEGPCKWFIDTCSVLLRVLISNNML